MGQTESKKTIEE
jgi:serine/threonine protein kinase